MLDGEAGAAERYLAFLAAGDSVYPLDALRRAGVDLGSPEPVEQTFAVLSSLVDRIEALVPGVTSASGPGVVDLLAQPLLAEGSVYERLRRHPDVPFDAQIGTGALVLDDRYREILADVHRGYLAIGIGPRAADARPDRHLARDGRTHRSVGVAGHRSQSRQRRARADGGRRGQIGRRDGGRGWTARPRGRRVPSWRRALPRRRPALPRRPGRGARGCRVDLLLGATLAGALRGDGARGCPGSTGLPYLIGFVVRPTGRLLDGTPLDEAVIAIDEGPDPPPVAFFLNCVHPRVAAAALAVSPAGRGRVIGLLANTSARDPDEFDGLEELEVAEPGPFGAEVVAVGRQYGLGLLGGCCGTGDAHIAAIARLLAGR